MTKTLAGALSLSILLQSGAAFAAPTRVQWSDAAVGQAQGLRFEKAVLKQGPAIELDDLGGGITLSPGVQKLLLRITGSGFTRVSGRGTTGPQAQGDDAAPLEQFQGALRKLAKKVAPTVVTIVAQGQPKAQNSLDQMFDDFEKAEPRPNTAPKATPKTVPNDKKQPKGATAMGSGVIVAGGAETLIVTNAHVVAIAGMNGKVKVFLKDDKDGGDGLAGTIQGFNAKYDLALVKLDKPCSKCQAAELGVNDVVEEDDLVLAVGTPFGLPQTKTFGIVSYVGRKIGDKSLVDDFIQTDASINSGNSGGPLFNIYGRVIAINTEIFSPNRGSIGLGFSIPVRYVIEMLERYRQYKTVAAARLGLLVKQTDAGMVVGGVEKDSAPEKAGFQTDDLIVAVDGVAAPKDMKAFLRLAADKIPGRAVAITVQRGKKTLTLSLTALVFDQMPEE